MIGYIIGGIVIVLFAILVIKSYIKKLSSGCCGTGGDEKTKKVKVRDKNKANYPFCSVLVVDGMVCGNCARTIENALNSLEGVWAEADVNAKQVEVRMKQQLDDQVLRDTVNHIGAYTVMDIRKA